MNQQIISAKNSPRLNEDSVLCWYEGDVFSITWKIGVNGVCDCSDDCCDCDEENFFNPTDHVIFQFYSEDNSSKTVAKFDFTDIQNNTVELKFTQAISKKMTAGNYTFCIKRVQYDEEGNVDQITTIGAKGNVKVEECH